MKPAHDEIRESAKCLSELTEDSINLIGDKATPEDKAVFEAFRAHIVIALAPDVSLKNALRSLINAEEEAKKIRARAVDIINKAATVDYPLRPEERSVLRAVEAARAAAKKANER